MRFASDRSKTPPETSGETSHSYALTRNPPVPHAGSEILKSGLPRGSGFITRMIESMRTRGVKYWPAPFLPSLAAFSSNPSNAAFNVHIHRRPVLFVDHCDDTFEVYRVIATRSRLSKNVRKESTGFAQLSQN